MYVYINSMELVWDLFPSSSFWGEAQYAIQTIDGLLHRWNEALVLCVVVESSNEFGFRTILESCSQGRRSVKCFETRGLPKAPILWRLAQKYVPKRIHIRICRVRLSGIQIAIMIMVLFFLFFFGLFVATFDRASNYEGWISSAKSTITLQLFNLHIRNYSIRKS